MLKRAVLSLICVCCVLVAPSQGQVMPSCIARNGSGGRPVMSTTITQSTSSWTQMTIKRATCRTGIITTAFKAIWVSAGAMAEMIARCVLRHC